jgi:hypothetical protein
MKSPSMLRRPTVLVALLGAALALPPLVSVLAQSGGSFDLSHNVIAGGGGTGQGSGNLQIEGTAAEHAATDTMSGGAFTQVGGFWHTLAPTPTPQAGPGVFAFSTASYAVAEACDEAVITVKRTNGNTGAASVDFATTNGTNFTPCNSVVGTAAQNCDYSYATGTLNFSTGDTFHTFRVLISKTAYAEGPLTVNLALSNATGGATLGAQSSATLTIIDDATIPTNSQPMDDAGTFVCQTYHDFLARQADGPGQAFWTSQITNCGASQTCINNQRITVSNAFFFELEYQQTGSYVYRLYRAAYGNTQPFPNPDNSQPAEAAKFPAYAVFLPDRARLIGSSNLAAEQLALAGLFAQRAAFQNKYPSNMSGAAFISAVLQAIQTADGANLSSQSANLLALYNGAGGGSAGQGAVMYRLANDDGANGTNGGINNRPFIDAEYNRAFVTTQYFGYLRRDGDIGGLLFWLGQVNSAPLRDTTKQHAMVCSFITSAEYQNRFSAVVTHTNAECPQ